MNPGLAEGGIMQTPNFDHTATRSKRSRRTVVLGAGALALALSIIGTAAAVGGRSSPTAPAHVPSITEAAPSGLPEALPEVPRAAAQPATSTSSTPAAPVLADGTYPTYITKVDVDGATITVDVIQVFQDEAAEKAALEDGMQDVLAEGLYIYVRNENPRLRTLAVARDVHIQFHGECESPGTRNAALTELAKKAKDDFFNLYYYDITVVHGAIHQIVQRLAQAAC
jgi:hypothetical protein